MAGLKPFSTGFLLCLSLCFDLGVVNLATLRASLQQGGMAGFLIGLGACAGDMVYFSLAVFGASALLGRPGMRLALWIFGTSALLYMVWRTAREVVRPHKLELGGAAAAERPGALLAMGAGLALASPTSILWFAAVGGGVIGSFGGDRGVLAPFAAGFFAAGVLWAAGFSYASAALRHALGDRLTRGLSAISAALFLYFAATVFLGGLRTFTR